MSEDQTYLLFESDIVANIDTTKAKTAIENLEKAVSTVSRNIQGLFDTTKAKVEGLEKVVGNLTTQVDAAADAIERADLAIRDSLNFEEQEREIGRLETQIERLGYQLEQQGGRNRELQKQISDLQRAQADSVENVSDSVENSTRKLKDLGVESGRVVGDQLLGLDDQVRQIEASVLGLMKRFSGGVLTKAADLDPTERMFTKDSIGRVEGAVADVKAIWRDLEIDVEASAGAIATAIEKFAKESALQTKKVGLDAKDVVKAWKWIFDILVGHSIIPDLIDRMEKELVDRAGKVLGEHKKYVEDALFPWTEARPEKLIRGFREIVDNVESEQDRLNRGIQKQAKVVDTAIETMLSGYINNWDDYLRKWRDLQGMSKYVSLANVEKQIERQGITTAEVIKTVDAANRKFGQGFSDTADKIKSSAANMAAGVVTSISQIPSKIATAYTNAVIKQFNDMPYKVAVATANTIREIGKLGSALKDTGEQLKDALFGPVRKPPAGMLGDIVSAFKPLVSQLGDVGAAAADATWESFVAGTRGATYAIAGTVKSIGDAILDQFKYVGGGLADILTFKSEPEKMRLATERAIALGMEKTAAQMRKARTQMGYDLDTTQQKTDYVMREIGQSFRVSLSNIGAAWANLRSGQLTFREGLGGMATAFRQTTRSMGLFTERAGVLDKAMSRTMGRMQKSLSGYRRENELTDKHNLRLAKSVDFVSDRLKEQAQIFIGMQQEEARATNLRIKALNEYLEVFNEVASAESTGTPLDAETYTRLGEKMSEAAKKLQDFGMLESVFADTGKDAEEVMAILEEYGRDTSISLSTVFKSTGENASTMFDKMTDQLEAMRRVFPKEMSMFNRAIQDIEQNSKHFITTLRDGGKISTERLQDMRLAFENLQTQLREIRKLQVIGTPEQQRYFEQMQRNFLQEAENFQLLVQRALVVQKTKEKLFGTTRRVAAGVVEIGKAAASYLPIVGAKSKLSAQQMEKLNTATGRVQAGTTAVSNALGQLDPVFLEVGTSAGYMGDTFRETVAGMAEIAQVKSASIVKAFSAIRLISAAVIGVFTSIIISTGKLAAEITTLGITMKTVAKNTGYNITQIEGLVDALKDTGITTRESVSALTQFMRARLPLEWSDPIQETTFRIEDLARAAQEVAVSMGEDSSEMFKRFIEFVTTGNSQLLNQAGIMANASNMLDKYAASVGKTVKQLTQREQYEALLAGLMQESTKLHGVYEEAMKSAGKQLGSMRRYMEELRYEWGKHFEPILATVIFRFNELLKLLARVPEETKETITTFVSIATAVSGLVVGISVLGPKLKLLFVAVKPILGLLTGKFGLLVALLAGAVSVIGKAFMKIPAQAKGIEGIMERINTLIDNFKIKEFVKPLVDMFEMANRHIQRIAYRIKSFFDDIKEKIGGFLDKNPELVKFLERMKTVIGDLFTVAYHVLDKVLGAIEDLLDQNWQGFFDKLRQAGTYLAAWLVEFFNEVVVVAYDWGKGVISSFAKGIIEWGRSVLPKAMTQIGDMIAMFLEGHSPPKVGPLSGIEIWGGNLMSTLERALKSRGVDFDESMFRGMGTLTSKSKAWGDNLIEVFISGIMEKAGYAIGPAMGEVGDMIARFLEGHSPPAEGRLAEIQDWGKNVFEAFLTGFEIADFDILDRGLDLIRTRLERLVGDAENGASQVASAMMKVREVVSEAIFQARATGGPLDLGGLRQIIVGTLTAYAQDVSALLEAMFDALQAEEAYRALEEKISAAREARQAAIDAAQDRLDAIRDEIEGINKQVKDLEKQMEAQIQAQLEAMGLIVNEELMNELQRQLAEANTEVQRAQRRIDKVRSAAGKYGQNILTWEEVNAQAQLELAEQNRDAIQDQIDVQEEIQREAERIREQITKQYKAQFDALSAQLEAAEARAEQAQDYLEQLRDADEDASKEEDKQLKAAKDYASRLAAHAELLEKLLEERMAAEEEAAKIQGDLAGKGEEYKQALHDRHQELAEKLHYWQDEWIPGQLDVPEFSNVFEKWLYGVGLSLEGGLPGLVEQIREKIAEWWEDFLKTPTGKFLEGTDIGGVFESLGLFLGNIYDAIVDIIGAVGELWKGIDEFVTDATGTDALGWLLYWGKELLFLVSKIVQIFFDLGATAFGAISGLLTGDWSNFEKAFHSFVEDAANLFARIAEWFGIDGEEILGFFESIREGVSGLVEDITQWFRDLPGKISEALTGLWDSVVGIWENIVDFLVGNSLIPELIGSIVGFFLGLPGQLLEMTAGFLGSAIALGQQLFDGIWQKVSEVRDNIGQWFTDVGTNVSGKAEELYGKALSVGKRVFDALWEMVAGETGILGSIAGWFTSIGETVAGTAEEMFEKAKTVAVQIWTAFYNTVFGEEGLVSKIGGWIKGLADLVGAEDILSRFAEVATTIGTTIVESISAGITSAAQGLIGVVKGLWNDHLRDGFNGVLNSIGGAINDIINIVNAAAGVIGYSGWPFPIPEIAIPQLPQLAEGGITLGNVIAQLHAGELIMPLDRLTSVLSGMQQPAAVPAFSPNIVLQGNATPSQVMPAVKDAWELYIEERRRA